ncbi:MAG: hypothetical protein WA971_07615 [Microbacterium sp.]
MAIVTVRAPGKVNRRIAGITFSEGRAEVDTDSAAYQFFRRRGYKISGAPEGMIDPEASGAEDERHIVPPAGTPLTAEELARVAASEAAGDPGGNPPDQSSDGDDEDGEQEQPERPHPVQGSKAVWFEHLSKLNPDHGFDLETVSRKELIAAVEAIEAAKG